jgi:coproporphyrinogen III oxidase
VDPSYGQWFRALQLEICRGLEELDGSGEFVEDAWSRQGGGGGYSRVLTNGALFEKAGVNWSEVYGAMDPAFASRLPGEGEAFYATGVSLVLHPRSPHVPTVHANFRTVRHGSAQWFGGGADLTPYYPHEEDAVHFHRTLQQACAEHGPRFYPQFKAWCDAYFYLPHRGETRGVGGIFFDYLGVEPAQAVRAAGAEAAHLYPEHVPHDAAWSFVRSAGSAFLAAYLPIAERRQGLPWTHEQRQFQLLRRGRYVEFNLLYDRGTTFGLRTGGRTESILMSMPPLARWEYDAQFPDGSAEARLQEFLRPRDWLGSAQK